MNTGSIGVISSGITHGEELVVISRKEYEKLTTHLRELQAALKKIAKGEHEFRLGKTVKISSLKELL